MSDILEALLAGHSRASPRLAHWTRSAVERLRITDRRLSEEESWSTLPVVCDTRALLARLLSVDDANPLLRGYRRPARQLEPGQAGHRTLQRIVDNAVDEGTTAAKAAAEIAVVKRQIAKIRESWGVRLPYIMERLLEKHRLTDGQVAGLRRFQDARRAAERAAFVSDCLAQFAGSLPSGDGCERPMVPDGAAKDEIRVMLQQRLRDRSAVAQLNLGARLARTHAVHRDNMRAAAGRGLGGRGLMQLAETTVEGRDETATLPLWGALLVEARDHLEESLRRSHWQPTRRPNSATRPSVAPLTGALVIPLDDRLVAISAAFDSCIVARMKSEKHGGTVELRLADDDPHFPLVLANLDLPLVFQHGGALEPGWYGTKRSARARLLYQLDGAWVGEIIEQGVLERRRTPAWEPDPPPRGGTRLVAPLYLLGAEGEVPVSIDPALAERRRYALGFATYPVLAPVSAERPLVIRVAEKGGEARRAALWREASLLSELRSSGHPGLEPVARARDGDAEGVLYCEPANGLPSAPAFPSASVLPVLSDLTRIVRSANAAGWAVGLLHPTVIGWALGVSNGVPRVVPFLAHAPLATRFGEDVVQAIPVAVATRLEFPRLGVRGIPPRLWDGAPAEAHLDAMSLGILALEMTARFEIPRDDWISWHDLPDHIIRNAGSFALESDWVSRLAEGIREGNDAELLAFCEWLLSGQNGIST